MQAFKAALRIVLSHPIYLIAYLGLLSCMGVFITASINFGSEAGEFNASEMMVAVIDQDESELSHSLTSFLDQNGQLVEVADDSFAKQDAIATGYTNYLLVIPQGYGEEFLKAARTNSAEPQLDVAFSYGTLGGSLVDEQVNQYLGLVRTAAALEPDAAAALVLEQADTAATQQANVETVKTADAGSPADKFAFYLQWGTFTMTAAIVVCVGVLMSAFNRTDVKRRNLISPVSNLQLGLQKAAGCLVVTVGVLVVSCGIGLAAFGSSLSGVPAAGIALTLGSAFVFSLVPLALGFLLGQLGTSDTMANAVGNISGMVMSFLGGAWISLDLLPTEVQTFSHFIPSYWYNSAVDMSIHLTDVNAATVMPILGNLGIVALFAVALFAIALAVGRLGLRTADAGGNAAASME